MDEERALQILEQTALSLRFEWIRHARRNMTKADLEKVKAACVKGLFREGNGNTFTKEDIFEAWKVNPPLVEPFTRHLIKDIPLFFPELQEYIRVPTGFFPEYFAAIKPKREAIPEQREGKNLARLHSNLDKVLLQYIDFDEDINKVLSKSVTLQKIWILATKQYFDFGNREIYITQGEYMEACHLKDRKSAAEELENAVPVFGTHYFIAKGESGKARFSGVQQLTQRALFIHGGRGNENMIALLLTEFTQEALDSNPGLYALIPAALMEFHGNAFKMGYSLHLLYGKSGRRAAKIRMDHLSQGLYNDQAKDYRRHYIRACLSDLEALANGGGFKSIRLSRKGRMVSFEEAAQLPLEDFLLLLVEAIPETPAPNRKGVKGE